MLTFQLNPCDGMAYLTLLSSSGPLSVTQRHVTLRDREVARTVHLSKSLLLYLLTN